MKFYLSLGGGLGFLLAFFGSLNAGNALAIVLRDAGLGCLGGALLMKGFRFVLVSSVRSAALQRGTKAAGKTDSLQAAGASSN